jgi:tripartite-type tricarboxylate transporter receptor subunit TctC
LLDRPEKHRMSAVAANRFVALTAAVLSTAALWSQPAHADDASDFYRGKTVTVIVGFGAGGGYDIYARLLAHYLGNHIPGTPNVVVQNMEGAGSVRASNYVYSVAPKDGTVIAAVNQNMPMYQMLGGAGAQFNATAISWLGSMAYSNGTLYTWSQSGINTLDDAKSRDVLLGGAGTTSDSYIYPTLINGLLGTRFKVINGYAGTKEIHLAIERGEVMGRGGNTWASLTSSNQDWIDQGKISILVQIGFKPEPELARVPLLIDLVKTPAEKQIVTVVTLPTALGYTNWLAPEVPPARMKVLREAYDATLRDRAFLDEAQKHAMMIRPQTGAEIEALIKQAASVPKPVLESTAQLLGWQK